MINFQILMAGGIIMIPLSILAIIALAIIIDKLFFIIKFAKCPQSLQQLTNNHPINLSELNSLLSKINSQNCFYNFFNCLNHHHQQKSLENAMISEAKIIEKKLNHNLWLLETIITSAPLLGLLGTIFGMSSAFKIIGNDTTLNASGITAGVAESLIATAFGLIIAVFTLFAFNYFVKIQTQILDEMEILANKIGNQISK